MLKNNRQMKILEMINEQDYLRVAEASEILDVSEMTIRRDLLDLEKEEKLIRVHGGAKKNSSEKGSFTELSHGEKKKMNVEEKKYIAKKAAALIKNDEIVFIGPGTTTEYIYDYLDLESAKIVTNSISVFNRFKDDLRYELILVGGRLRERTGSFVGYFSRKWVEDIHVDKVFIGANGIKEGRVTTAEEEEGFLQRMILDNAKEKYVLVDSSKFNVEAFQIVTTVDRIDALITDEQLNSDCKNYYQNKCKIIN